MFNDLLIKEYYKTRIKDYFFKEELLYLNEENVPYDNEKRKDVISRSLLNLDKQLKLRQEIKKDKTDGFVNYWEKLGFFSYEEETKITLSELMFLSKEWLENFSVLVDFAILLTLNNDSPNEYLYLREDIFEKHKEKNSSYYSTKEDLTVSSIMVTSCFLQSSVFSTSKKTLSPKSEREVFNLSMNIELKFLLLKEKDRIPEEKHELFSEILYSLLLMSQNESIDKTNNIVSMSEEEYNLVLNLNRSLNDTMDYLEENESLIKIAVKDELKR